MLFRSDTRVRNKVNCKRWEGRVRNPMSEPRPLRLAEGGIPSSTSPDQSDRRRSATTDDTQLTVDIRELVERGALDEARERFALLVAAHQRRASRIAFQYLRDGAEADEAVQDAFVKVFSHIASYQEAWPFEVWFTRILINGCLDRRKARARRERWLVPATEAGDRKSTRLNSSHIQKSRMPSSA